MNGFKKIDKLDAFGLLFSLATPLILGEPFTFDLVAIFYLIFMCFVFGKASILINKPLIFLGSISYSLYLIHQNIGYNLIYFLENNGVNANLAILSTLIFSITVAYLIYKFVEQPSLIYLRQRYKNSSFKKLLIKN